MNSMTAYLVLSASPDEFGALRLTWPDTLPSDATSDPSLVIVCQHVNFHKQAWHAREGRETL